MKTAFISLRLEEELKEQIVTLSKKERRSFSDEAAHLMELGILSITNATSSINVESTISEAAR